MVIYCEGRLLQSKHTLFTDYMLFEIDDFSNIVTLKCRRGKNNNNKIYSQTFRFKLLPNINSPDVIACNFANDQKPCAPSVSNLRKM